MKGQASKAHLKIMATSDFKKHAVKIHRVVIMVCLITAIYIRNVYLNLKR